MRDLKPDNVFLVPDPVAPGGERAKLLDFGIAKLVQSNMDHTGTMVIMGTPSYMSPEQCRGAGTVTDRTDVYSLGTMLYQMVSGRLPFLGEGSGDLIGQHLHVEPLPLSSLVPDAPPLLTALVHRLLIKDKERRPPMRETLTELRRLLDGGTGPLRPPGPIAGLVGSGSLNGASASMVTVSTLGRLSGESRGQPRSSRPRLYGAVAFGALLVLGGAGVRMTWHRRSSEPDATPRRGSLSDSAGRVPAQQTESRPAGEPATATKPPARTAPLAIAPALSPVAVTATSAGPPSMPEGSPVKRADPANQAVQAGVERVPQAPGISQPPPHPPASRPLRVDITAPAHEPAMGTGKVGVISPPKRASVAMISKPPPREPDKAPLKPHPPAKPKAGHPVEYED